MKQKLRKLLPHVAIVLCNMYIVFFLIDRVNTAMQFINNSITKALLLILCIISTVNASFLIQEERAKLAARNRRQPARGARTAGARTASARTAGARANQGTQAARTARPAGAQAARTARSSAARGTAARPASGQRPAARSASGRNAAK